MFLGAKKNPSLELGASEQKSQGSRRVCLRCSSAKPLHVAFLTLAAKFRPAILDRVQEIRSRKRPFALTTDLAFTNAGKIFHRAPTYSTFPRTGALLQGKLEGRPNSAVVALPAAPCRPFTLPLFYDSML
jgi:hypothetical protein